jgi:flavocytochrome c
MRSRNRRDGITRRQFLKNAGIGTGIIALSPISVAKAAQWPKGIKTEKHGVVVVGAGFSALSAAVEAKLNGADVVVLEKTKMDVSGGNSRICGGMICVPLEKTKQAKDDYYEDFMKKSMGNGDPDLSRLLAENTMDGVDWLKNQGVEFLPPAPVVGYRAQAIVPAPGLYRGMPKVLEKLREILEKQGGKIVYETKAKELIMGSNGRIAGIKAIDKAGVKDYMADAVVIASGGFAANKEMLVQWIDPHADGMMVRGRPWITGDGIKIAEDAGALLVGMGGMTALHVAAVSPQNTAAGNPFMAVPLYLGINKDGKRYVDESKGYVVNGKATMKQPGQQIALVFDEEVKNTGPGATGYKLFQGLNIPIIEADTVEQLASKIEVPPATLKATIEEFNNAVKDGKALGINPPKEANAKVMKPKFYAFYPMVPGITLTFGGIRVNTNAQALEADGRIIPGLYAAGESVGGLFYDDYVGGGSLARCLVLGRIAGKNAAAEKIAIKPKKEMRKKS